MNRGRARRPARVGTGRRAPEQGLPPFADFVAAHRPALLGTALLLAGDRVSAESLVQTALARAGRRWPRLAADGDAATAVLGLLAAAAARRRSGLLHGEQVIETAGPAQLPNVGAQFARTLRELPPRTRAVVVLRAAEELPPATTARLLHLPPATVDDETARGFAALAAALPPGGYQRLPVDDDVRVRDELALLARAPGRWQLDAQEAVADARQRARRRRRRAAVAVAAACLIGIGFPLAGSLPDRVGPLAAAPAPATPAPTAVPVPPDVPVLVGPARGSLAGDQAFLAAVRQVGWGALEPPPPDQRDVVFAGDTSDGRAVLVVGQVLDDFRGVWLTGPVGAAPTALRPHVPPELGQGRPLTLVLGGPGPATLVVVAGRQDAVQVSDRLMTGPRGTVGRDYAPVATVDGVAVVPVTTTVRGTATSVRVLRDGAVVDRSGVDWPSAGRAAGGLPAPAPLRPPGGPPDDLLVAAAVTGLSVPLGAEPEALGPQLLWSGPFPGRAAGSVAVVLVHSPGGALVVGTWASGPYGAVSCGVQTPPGNTAVDALTAARVCDVTAVGYPGAQTDRWLVVTAPPAAATAQVLDEGGRTVAWVPLPGGSTLVPLPGGAVAVRTVGAAGQELTEVPVAPMATVPFGDFGPGHAG